MIKEVSIKNIVFLMVLTVLASSAVLVNRVHVRGAQSVPIFMGEEVVVGKTAAVVGVKAPAIAEQAVKLETPALPVPPPAAVQPLPLVPPSVTFKVLPVYPSSALEKGMEGTVLLSVYVGLSGVAEKIETKTSSGITGIDESAKAAVSQWQFTPASQGGTALASWFEVPVRFVLK